MSSEHDLPEGHIHRPAAARPDDGPAGPWTVDGLEDTPQGPVARLELPDGQMVVVPLGTFPGGVREGDLLEVAGGPDGLHARRLPERTLERREAAQRRLDALNAPEGAPGDRDPGEITL